ncbi:MAG: tRNA (adenosine(37)-N6)-threonylcarbamoyltransferase complex transferase subunit TsaD [Bacilli bacterium]|jgi:N6-L-threonylcarbamoyladenine synthase
MKDFYVLAIETSCDETSVSIVKNGQEEISLVVLSQMDIHQKYGGVVPEIASRLHIENITIVIEEALNQAKMDIKDIDVIGVTYGPGLIGSLLIGVQAAKVLSFLYDKPLVPVHHIIGHIYANKLTNDFTFPLVALVVSGGHSDLIYMKEDYKFEKLGGTLDDAVGEAYDKVARILKLGYPGGPIIDKLSLLGNLTYDLPYPYDNETLDFSFSGIKSAVLNLVNKEIKQGNEIRVNDLARTFQERVVTVLVKKAMLAVKKKGVQTLLLAGGVAANKELRKQLTLACEKENIRLIVPSLRYCTDNAAMIGVAAYYAYQKGIIADFTLDAKAVDDYISS